MNRTAGLPNIPINSVTVDPANFKRVWVAADVGVYQSLDLGATWGRSRTDCPTPWRSIFCFTAGSQADLRHAQPWRLDDDVP